MAVAPSRCRRLQPFDVVQLETEMEEEQDASKLEPLLVDQAEAEGPGIEDGSPVTSSDYWREKYYRWTNEVGLFVLGRSWSF